MYNKKTSLGPPWRPGWSCGSRPLAGAPELGEEWLFPSSHSLKPRQLLTTGRSVVWAGSRGPLRPPRFQPVCGERVWSGDRGRSARGAGVGYVQTAVWGRQAGEGPQVPRQLAWGAGFDLWALPSDRKPRGVAASSGSRSPGSCPAGSGKSPLGPASGKGPAWGQESVPGCWGGGAWRQAAPGAQVWGHRWGAAAARAFTPGDASSPADSPTGVREDLQAESRPGSRD